ncbi:MAG: hypothetical protein EON58_19530 [Alphaproteobacteria bacterium]|nr:MAG: hypothetical protein EON58_19530 [Alphaproteobacteria bacterium]
MVQHYQMMRLAVSFIVSAIGGLSPLVSIAAPASASLPLARSSPWDLSYDDRSCDLIGTFGSGSEAVTLTFSRYSPYDDFEMRISGQRFASDIVASLVTLDFGPAIKPVEVTTLNGRAGDQPMMILGAVDLQRANASSGEAPTEAESGKYPLGDVRVVTINTKVSSTTLQLGSLAGAATGLQQCVDRMVREWGLDPHQLKNMKAGPHPKSSPGFWLTLADYPSAMLARDQAARIIFRLGVDETGRVSNCRIVSAAGDAKFQQVTCRALRDRAQFTPALDAGGRPMQSVYINTVKWIPAPLRAR